MSRALHLMVLYIGLLAFAMSRLSEQPDDPWRYVIVLLPMIPGVWLALGMVKAISKLDEMERRILLGELLLSRDIFDITE